MSDKCFGCRHLRDEHDGLGGTNYICDKFKKLVGISSSTGRKGPFSIEEDCYSGWKGMRQRLENVLIECLLMTNKSNIEKECKWILKHGRRVKKKRTQRRSRS